MLGLLIVIAFTGLQNVIADQVADQSNVQAKQIPFPVVFSEDEPPDSQDYLVKMIRTCTILDRTNLRPSFSFIPQKPTQLDEIFKGCPVDAGLVTAAIIAKQQVCTCVRPSDSRYVAGEVGNFVNRIFEEKMYALKWIDEWNCEAQYPQASKYFCRDKLREHQKTSDYNKEQLNKNEQEFFKKFHCSPQCATYVRDILNLVDTTIDSALIERTEYLKAIEIQQQKIAAEKGNQESALKLHQEKEFENYASAIKSGSKPIQSMKDAMIYYDPIDGSSYATNPPLKFPDEKRYLSLEGVVETINGDTIVCTVGDNPNWGRWGFRTSKMKSYIPRQGEPVQSIGRIVSLDKGQTLLGRDVFFVVIDPVAIAINDLLFYSR